MHLLTLSLLFSINHLDPTPGLDQIEAAALLQRTTITSLTARIVDREEDKPTGDVHTTNFTVWTDFTKYRFDKYLSHPSQKEFSGRRKIECWNCERPGYYIEWYDLPKLAASFNRRATTPESVPSDPRLIGYVPAPYSTLFRERVDSYIGGASNRQNVTLTREVYNRSPCWVVRSPSVPDQQDATAIWYDIDRGMHPVRIEVTVDLPPPDDAKFTLTNELQQVAPGLWYPSKVMVDNRIGSETTISTLTISDVTVNQLIPASTFAFAGLGLPENTVVSAPSEKGRALVWRGGKLVSYDQAKTEWDVLNPSAVPDPTPLDPPAKRSYWLYALGAVLAVAALLLLRRAIRKAS